MKKYILSLLSIIYSTILLAENGVDASGMANVLRSSGKIYVVISVIVTIFIGLVIFLIRTDRKVSSIEKEIKNLK